MFRNTRKTTVLLAGLGGLMVAIGSLFGFGNLFRTHPTTAERVARLRAAS